MPFFIKKDHFLAVRSLPQGPFTYSRVQAHLFSKSVEVIKKITYIKLKNLENRKIIFRYRNFLNIFIYDIVY